MILHLKTKVEYIDSHGFLFVNFGQSFSFQIEYIQDAVIGQELDVWLYMILKEIENKMDLKFYGFNSINSISHFENLMSISGVGPKMAFNLLKSMDISILIEIIKKGEYEKIKKIPGIGDKLAKRIILELSRMYSKDDSILDKINTQQLSTDQNQVILSLTSMGYDKSFIIDIINSIDPTLNRRDLLQEVLLRVSKNAR